jgi:AcrR family transcriptional regulator
MTASSALPRQKLTAEERRETVVKAALVEFAEGGLFGTSTESIAARAGISQPYIFRLFGTKQELFLVTADRCFRRILDSFKEAAASVDGDPFPLMAAAYSELLTDRGLLMVWMHAFAACSVPEVQACIAGGFKEMYEFLESLPGATPEKVSQFMSKGMFLNVAAATNMRAGMTDAEWSRRCVAVE